MAWTEITRAKYQRDGLRYASGTAGAEWAVIEPHLPPQAACGRTRTTKLRDVVDAIFYIAQSGCQWRLWPKDFPPFTTVQRYFYAWRDNGLWQSINHALAMMQSAQERSQRPWLCRFLAGQKSNQVRASQVCGPAMTHRRAGWQPEHHVAFL